MAISGRYLRTGERLLLYGKGLDVRWKTRNTARVSRIEKTEGVAIEKEDNETNTQFTRLLEDFYWENK